MVRSPGRAFSLRAATTYHHALMKRIRNLALFAIVAGLVAVVAVVALRPVVQRAMGVNVDIGGGSRADIVVPDGYVASVFAEGLASPRFMAVSGDGVLFVADRGADRVIALPDRDGDGTADEVVEVGRGYGSAHSVAFEADGALLVAGETTLFRLRLGDDLKEAERSVVLDGLTTGGHSTRTVAVLPDGGLLLSAGSTCNVCVEADERRAAINLLPAAGGSSRVYMTGLRNAVGLWVDPETGRAWATNMGRDWLGDDLPPETVYEVLDGADGGWPRCHAGDLVDPEFGGDRACAGVAQPAATFGAHTAPLALVGWEEHLVVALHGSWNRSDKAGYAVWWLPWDGQPAGEPEPFASGFLPEGSQDALGRPAGLAVGADGALYVSDDKAGFIYRIARR
jgi:glucose/arabinose dehydrogenase